MRYIPLTRANRPRVVIDRDELASKVVRSCAWGVQYGPTSWERLLRALRIMHPCSLHGRDRWCTNCPEHFR